MGDLIYGIGTQYVIRVHTDGIIFNDKNINIPKEYKDIFVPELKTSGLLKIKNVNSIKKYCFKCKKWFCHNEHARHNCID